MEPFQTSPAPYPTYMDGVSTYLPLHATFCYSNAVSNLHHAPCTHALHTLAVALLCSILHRLTLLRTVLSRVVSGRFIFRIFLSAFSRWSIALRRVIFCRPPSCSVFRGCLRCRMAVWTRRTYNSLSIQHRSATTYLPTLTAVLAGDGRAVFLHLFIRGAGRSS